MFGAKPASSVGFSFAPTTTTAPIASTGLFGASTAAPLFGATQPPAQAGGLFGATAAKPTGIFWYLMLGFSFGATTPAPAPFGSIGPTGTSAPSLFGSTPALGQPAATSGLFGPAVTTQPTTGLFGASTTSFAQPAGGLFGSSTAPKLGKSTET
jgi:nuclear pore complex protein Nup62